MSNFDERMRRLSPLYDDDLTDKQNKKIKKLYTQVRQESERLTSYCIRNQLLKKILEKDEKIEELNLVIHELKLMLKELQK